ncbi:hypothetical protein DP885_10780 [Salmonella enterica subsp. diarizonae]|nr:hypothetical protein [Salmonella enterica]ECC9262037.1 hypothetical protein [Salmonella enterica subsp. diarizonae]ECC9369514.1 hypothetical protein [Salmonella enterica subsp. diarizonae]
MRPDHHGKKRKVLSSGSSQYGVSGSRDLASYENFRGKSVSVLLLINLLFLCEKDTTCKGVF